MKKKLFILSILILKILIKPQFVQANEDFISTSNITYQIFEDGQVKVVHEISLTNKLANVYASSYSLLLRGIEIENLQAFEQNIPLKTALTKNNDTLTIKIDFSRPVVGTGKTLNFRLLYDSPKIAQKNGQVWVIDIPKLSTESQIDNYQLTLITPESFGNPTFVSPKPNNINTQNNLKYFYFSKEQLANTGLTASFGLLQIFDFQIKYRLDNQENQTNLQEIALPPDTIFQRVFYQEITPSPLNIRIDSDGNWLAQYRLKPQEKLAISAKAKVKIFPGPINLIKIKPEYLKINLLPQKYWEVSSPIIQNLAKELKTPRNIYDYVVKSLNYDFEKARLSSPRLGALQALTNPNQALCMEFSDLFIALSRAANIPARELNGFAYTADEKLQNLSLTTDILHSWPEYYDRQKNIWLPIDPTWEKTTHGIDYFSKIDLNHVVFVIHGENSIYPLSAGSYKDLQNFGKDIQINFGKLEKEAEPSFKATFSIPNQVFFIGNTKGKIKITNTGQTALYQLKSEINSQNLKIRPENNLIEALPPFAYQEIPLIIKVDNFWRIGTGKIVLNINNQIYTKNIRIISFWLFFIPLALTIIPFIFFLTKKRFYARIRKDEKNL